VDKEMLHSNRRTYGETDDNT